MTRTGDVLWPTGTGETLSSSDPALGFAALSAQCTPQLPHENGADDAEDTARLQADMQSWLDGLAENAAVLADDGTILLTNKGWRRAARQGGYATLIDGGNYIEVIQEYAAAGIRQSVRILERLADLSAGRRDHCELTVKANGPAGVHQFKMQLSRVRFGDTSCNLMCALDVTDHYELVRMRRSIGNQLLLAQDRERRLIVRELHDSTGQELTVLQLSLRQLKRIPLGVEARRALAECDEALKRVNQEIRTLSFMNHPPALDDWGLVQAIENLARGFGARAGIKVDVDLALDPEIPVAASKAMVLYRLTQEALTNIHRHADASNVMLRLVPTKGLLHLIVQDDGKGICDGEKPTPGVGLAGMTERLREVGGRLSIRRLAQGTVLRASIPFRRHAGTTSALAASF